MSDSELINEAGAVLVTGATSGLGRELVLDLAARGRKVIVGGRQEDLVNELISEVNANGEQLASAFMADLSDLDDVRRALREFEVEELHGIVANAGVSSADASRRSAQGYELTFAVNVLAHQLILAELLPKVVDGGRVVIVSSSVHLPDNKSAQRSGVPAPKWMGTAHLADPDNAPPGTVLENGKLAYSTSKLGNVMQANGFQRVVDAQDRSVDVFALDPGIMTDTELSRELSPRMRKAFVKFGELAASRIDKIRPASESAALCARLVEGGEWAGKGFAYTNGASELDPSPIALDERWVGELFSEASELVGVSNPLSTSS